MTKFQGCKTLQQIKAACKETPGFEIDTLKHDQEGSDWVTIYGLFDGQSCTFIYSAFSGRFIGQLDDGTMYSERSTDLDGTGWYDAILNLLYIPAETEVA